MRLSPSSFIIFCLLRSSFNLGFRWGGSLVDDTVRWSESLHDRLHISHTSVGLVLTKVQNWQIHCGRDHKKSHDQRQHCAQRDNEAQKKTCLCVFADGDLKLENSGATGGRVARRGRSHTSQRTLLP